MGIQISVLDLERRPRCDRTIESNSFDVVLVDFRISQDVIASFRDTVPDCTSKSTVSSQP